jgi:SAM-dependent methyltransferase
MDSAPTPDVQLLLSLCAWRQSRLAGGEDAGRLAAVIDALSVDDIAGLTGILERTQVAGMDGLSWSLSPAAHLKLVACGLRLARERQPQGVVRLDFGPLVVEAGDFYVLRMLEAMMRELPWRALYAERPPAPASELGMFTVEPGDDVSGGGEFVARLQLSELGAGLLPVLRRLEDGDRVEHFTALKQLLDVFDLRADELDRGAHALDYLGQMAGNAEDKAKLLQFVVPGVVVDVGCAGGAMLELLEAAGAGATSRLIGIDRSSQALDDLEYQRQQNGGHYELIEGEASALRRLLEERDIEAPSTIIFCSVLHEVYSYGRPGGARFDLSAVEEVLGEALQALRPGGRLLIRDGVEPEDGEALQIMSLQPRASFDFFESYVEQFEGRKIAWQLVADQGHEVSVRLSCRDAMEFMFTFVWGREAFPYEVREQYGVLTRAGYLQLIAEVAARVGVTVSEVSVPAEWQTYLQQGYEEKLRKRLRLTDEAGTAIAFPPSNMLVVIERAE